MTVLIVRLRSEDPQDVLAEAGDDTGALVRSLTTLDRDAYPYMAYVDPFGLTIFNRVQMEVVIPELLRLRDDASFHGLHGVMERILELATRCRDGVHLYLEFEGD